MLLRIWIVALLGTTGAAMAQPVPAEPADAALENQESQGTQTPSAPEAPEVYAPKRLGIFAASVLEPNNVAQMEKLRTLLRAGNYKELERLTQKALKDFKEGRLSEARLNWIFGSFKDETSPESHHDAWIRQFPKSYPARLARGIYHRTVGIAQRGDKFIKDTSPEQLAAMRASMELALSDLQASLEMDDRPVLSYVFLISIGRYYKGRAFLNRQLNDALQLDPKNFLVRQAYLTSLEPRWGGSIAAMESFIDKAKLAGLTDPQISELEGQLEHELADLYWTAKREEDEEKEIAHRANALRVFQKMPDKFWQRYVSLLLKHNGCREAMAGLEQLINSKETKKEYLIWLRTQRSNCLYQRKDFEAALVDIRAVAEYGDIGAQLTLGEWLYHGYGGPKNTTEAMTWFRKAAAQGDARAQKLVEGVHDHP